MSITLSAPVTCTRPFSVTTPFAARSSGERLLTYSVNASPLSSFDGIQISSP